MNRIETERRWLKSVIAASREPLPKMAWMRVRRNGPETMAKEAAPRPQAHHLTQLFTRPGAAAAR